MLDPFNTTPQIKILASPAKRGFGIWYLGGGGLGIKNARIVVYCRV